MPEIDPREPYRVQVFESGTRVEGPGLEKWAEQSHPKADRPRAANYKRTVQVQLPRGQTRTAHGAWVQRATGGGYLLHWDALS